MKTIYKYFLRPSHCFGIDMPIGAEILSFQSQKNELVIWVLVDEKPAQYESKCFAIFGTGQQVDDGIKKYIGTAQQENGNLVWHLFERDY